MKKRIFFIVIIIFCKSWAMDTHAKKSILSRSLSPERELPGIPQARNNYDFTQDCYWHCNKEAHRILFDAQPPAQTPSASYQSTAELVEETLQKQLNQQKKIRRDLLKEDYINNLTVKEKVVASEIKIEEIKIALKINHKIAVEHEINTCLQSMALKLTSYYKANHSIKIDPAKNS